MCAALSVNWSVIMIMDAILQALLHDLTGRGEAPDEELWADDDDDGATGTVPVLIANSPHTPATSVIVIDDDTVAPAGARLSHKPFISSRLCASINCRRLEPWAARFCCLLLCLLPIQKLRAATCG